MNRSLPLLGRRRRRQFSPPLCLLRSLPGLMYYSEVSTQRQRLRWTGGGVPWIDTRPNVLVTPDALHFAANLGTHVLDEVPPIAS